MSKKGNHVIKKKILYKGWKRNGIGKNNKIAQQALLLRFNYKDVGLLNTSQFVCDTWRRCSACTCLGCIAGGAQKKNQTLEVWLSGVHGAGHEGYIFMMDVKFNSRVIVHCVRVQRKYELTQEIYITWDSVCIWKCLPQFLLKLPLKPNTACIVCPDTKT